MDETPIKTEGNATRHRAGYKSWKKKYRKMRITFDQKMHDGEELHKQEARAVELVKRIATENDTLLDLLLEINNSPQIPPEKQVNVSLDLASQPHSLALSFDDRGANRDAAKKLQELLSSVPHSSYKQAKEGLSPIIDDLKAPEGESYPADFLTADDIDNYIYDVDKMLEPDNHFPTLAPLAHPENHPTPHPNLKNPTSVTNWLRKHAPKIFLQDGETHGDAEDGEGGHTGGRKSRGGRGERGGRASTRGKRVSAAARSSAAERGDWDASMDEDAEPAVTPASRGGKRKRNDDDTGYKPRGSSTRPTKKKRKSEVDGTPSVRKTKKETAASARDD